MKKVLGNILPALLTFHPHICYVVMAIWGNVDNLFDESVNLLLSVIGIFYVMIVLANIIYVIIWTCMGGDSQRILFWNMLMKICYIPIFIGTFISILAGLCTFMVGGIALVAVMLVVDVILLIPPSIYGLCGCIRAAKEKNANVGLAVVMAIMHFIFCLDVVAAIVMYFVVRNKNRKRRDALNMAYGNYY